MSAMICVHRQAVDAMSGRAGSASRYSLQLENQDGTAMRIDSEQRSLITMGLTLHESGKKLLAKVQATATDCS